MNLIEKIEISYFRSLYKVTLSDVSRLNIFSGANDVGKSNVLKALNLYFNGFTDWSTEINFYQDFNKRRLEEVRSESIKGKQMIWIAITFRRPDSYSGSLPKTFRVKKKWLRTNEEKIENNLGTKEKYGELPSSKSVAERFLSRFLNKIEFEYVPAIRDRDFYNHLLSRLQRLILKQTSGDEELSATVDNLTSHIEPKIGELKKEFERIANIDSSITPPTDVTSLFQSFNVSTRYGQDHKVPLEQRGDGVQSQYLLSVLRHMCSNSNGYHVWAFEEPENSLEYSRVKQLSNDIKKDCQSAQVFLTTHSPALVNIDESFARRYRVHKSSEKPTKIIRVDEKSSGLSSLESEIGINKIKSDLYEDYSRKIDQIKELEERLHQLEDEKTHQVFVEGKTDAQILRTAYRKLEKREPSFEISPADPYPPESSKTAAGAGMLAQWIESVRPTEDFMAIAVFDRDDEGKREYRNLSNNFDCWNEQEDIKIHGNDKAVAILLPVPKFRSRKHSICIEKMFPDDVIKRKNEKGYGLKTEKVKPVEIRYNNGQGERLTDEQLKSLSMNLSNKDFTIKSGKNVFANDIVPNLSKEKFSSFKTLFKTIDEILGGYA